MKSVEKSFWSKVNKAGPIPEGHPEYDDLGPCWLFSGKSRCVYTSRKDPDGLWGSRRMLAHRYSYIIHIEPIPEGLVVRHRCDNDICVNPDHLLTGTQAENVADMRRRGSAPQRRLTASHVAQMRDLVDAGCPPIDLCRLMADITGSHLVNVKKRLYLSPEAVIGRGPPKRVKAPNLDPETLEGIKAAALGGSSLRAAIAAHAPGRDWESVRDALQRVIGWDYRAFHATRSGDVQRAIDENSVVPLWDEGLSVHQIGQRVGITHHRVKTALARRGIVVERRYRRKTA